MSKLKRISITVDDDIAEALSAVKKDKFYDKSFADMYRYLIAEGVKQATKKGKK